MALLNFTWHGMIVLFFLIVFYTGQSTAQFSISCYECQNCTDPFQINNNYILSSCYACYKLTVTVAYAPFSYVIRRCLKACIETSQTFGGGSIISSCCTTNLCNASSTINIPFILQICVFLLIFYIKLI